ncbi:MAG TPA: lasso RiPP family leader peptide-containing protein [Dehalococcoidia bacterium]|jgi:hypothetical protein|nr:lasso RiPP family leader peptide-containing protein [Dehalococcoidia bacterium]
MGEKRPYQKPALQAYGDIRAVTAGFDFNKEHGPADYLVVFKDSGGTPPPGNLSGE